MVSRTDTTARARWPRLAGLVLLLIPIAVLLLFAAGETLGGDLSGLQHLVQLAPLVVLAVVAWRWPRVGGPLLVGIGAALALLYFLMMRDGRLPSWAVLTTALVLFAPPIAAGLMFWAAGRHFRSE